MSFTKKKYIDNKNTNQTLEKYGNYENIFFRRRSESLDGKTLFEAEEDPGSLQLGGGDELAPRDCGGSGGGPRLVPRVEAAVSMSRLFLSREKLLRVVADVVEA